MRYHLIDRITEVEPGKSLRAFKQLTLAEEYLADHFPSFPVMPGVFMLQVAVEAASWLVRLSMNYEFSVLVLREVKSVKYGTFFAPGNRMTMAVEQTTAGDGRFAFKAKGEVGGQTTVSTQFTLAGYNLRDRNPAWASRDEELVRSLRSHGDWLYGPR